MNEQQIENNLIAKLQDLKYTYRQDIRDRAALEIVGPDVGEYLGSDRLGGGSVDSGVEQQHRDAGVGEGGEGELGLLGCHYSDCSACG